MFKKNPGGSKHKKNDSNKLYIKLKTKIEDYFQIPCYSQNKVFLYISTYKE